MRGDASFFFLVLDSEKKGGKPVDAMRGEARRECVRVGVGCVLGRGGKKEGTGRSINAMRCGAMPCHAGKMCLCLCVYVLNCILLPTPPTTPPTATTTTEKDERTPPHPPTHLHPRHPLLRPPRLPRHLLQRRVAPSPVEVIGLTARSQLRLQGLEPPPVLLLGAGGGGRCFLWWWWGMRRMWMCVHVCV